MAAVLAASRAAQFRAVTDEKVVGFLASIRDATLHSLRMEAFKGQVFSTSQAVLDYFRIELAHAPSEQVRVLFVDAQNHLIRDALLGMGSIDQVAIYPREVLRQAIEANAAGLILIHNHPSGDPTPSEADKKITFQLARAAQTLGINFHDHLIIGRGGWTSFRSLNLL